MAKEAEDKVTRFAKYFGMGWHKYGDVRYCIHCKQPLPKSENMPDYSVWAVFTYIEAKNSNADQIWKWKEDIGPEGRRQNQRKFLKENGGWLLLELGHGVVHIDPVRSDKSAYLIPFAHWVERIEPYLLKEGYASLRRETITYRGQVRPGADEILHEYRMEWIAGTRKEAGSWVPPAGHCWWHALYGKLESWIQFCEQML